MYEITHTSLKAAREFLVKNDPALGKFIQEIGVCSIIVKDDYFQSLVSSIVSQQLSTKAADTIYGRLQTLSKGNIDPLTIKEIPRTDMRSIGISESKSRFINELAHRYNESEFSSLHQLENEEVLKFLTSFTGIGEWTAHIFMIFSLGRIDVFPLKDVGLKNGMKRIYNLEESDEKLLINIAEKWSPYKSIGSWYVWKSLSQFQ
ncbi:MAG: DNA-3-methyladenine glycosylase family protein [Bacteroidota bacterium]